MSSTCTLSDGEASDVICSGQEYEVFLSFRGPDTRDSFTDFLYTRLIDAGIRTYRDDEELGAGEEIGPELIAGINQSKIAIPIFSKGYAASKWCLKELAYIVECKRSGRLKVMPIFYDVTPSEVRNQTGTFGEAFVSHEKLYNDETVRGWKEAVKVVGALKGWDVQNDRYRQQGKLVNEVTTKVLCELKKACVAVTDPLVGIDCHVGKILNKVCAESGGVKILGIYGMGGIGKTTLAKVVYNSLLSQFENSSFLADVRETSRTKRLEFLQNQLICDISKTQFPRINNINEGIAAISTRLSNKKALIVLDDVDENFQVQGLVGNRNWFGSGTRIIITTRNKSVLDFIEVDWPFEHKSLDGPQALQLFSTHAFRYGKPPETHNELSRKIVNITGGLPLALEVIGSSLCGKSMKYWHNIVKKLEKVPHEEVVKKLRISIDSLDERQKHIFLDIACFFIGVDHRIAVHYWDDIELFPGEAIEVLQQMSLIKVGANNLLWMHDQLRDCGRDMVYQENIMNPEKRSRLWDAKEAARVFMTKGEKENIQGISVVLEKENSYPYFTEKEFAKLCKLRLFWVKNCYRDYPPIRGMACMGWLPFRFNCLPEKPHIFSELRWLSWDSFAYTHIEISNYSLWNLTILSLHHCSFTNDWDGWSQIKMATNLKVLDLFCCDKLVKSPDFSSHPRLERLILKSCSSLVEIDESICELKHLVHINLRDCWSLRKLPRELHCTGSLTELLIDCPGIVEIPQWCDMVELEVFSATHSFKLNSISLNSWTSLKKLSLTCSKITSIPDSIGECVSLLELDLSSSTLLKKLPESMGGLVSLIQLDIKYSGIEELPNSIGCLKNLKVLHISHNPIRILPTTIGMARNLEELDASYCPNLSGLPKLPESLIKLLLPWDTMAMIPALSNLVNMRQLKVPTSGCVRELPGSDDEYYYQDEIYYECFYTPSRKGLPLESPGPGPEWIGSLSKAENLELVFPTVTILHPDLGTLYLLKELVLKCCYRLESIPKLPSHLTSLRVYHCESLVQLEIPPTLEVLDLEECHNLVEISGRVESLKELRIRYCNSLVKIMDVLNVKTLEELKIVYCLKLDDRNITHRGPILMDNSPKSESERRFMSTMLKICGHKQSTSCLGMRKTEGKGKEIEEAD